MIIYRYYLDIVILAIPTDYIYCDPCKKTLASRPSSASARLSAEAGKRRTVSGPRALESLVLERTYDLQNACK